MAAKKVARPPHKAPPKAREQESGKGGKTFDNTNRGVLFVNDKGDNDARPDYTGNVFVEIPEGVSSGDLVKFRLAGWIKTPNKGGDDFVSLTIQKDEPKEEKSSGNKGFAGKRQ